MFGLNPDNLRNIKNCFAQLPKIEKVLIYGSRAKGNYRNGSDIDITLIGKKLTLDNSIYPLQNKLEELYLPYQFDISIFDTLDNLEFISHILRVGKTFYEKNNENLPEVLEGSSKDWELTALGKVCEVIAGQSPESKFYNTNEEGLPFYQGKKEFTEKYIGEPTKWTTKITKEAIENDILMSVRAPVGPINFATQKICIGRGLASIRAGRLIDKEFLFSFLLKHENEIVGNTGAVFNSINKAQIGAIQIPLPPLPEQKRIVSVLDKVFAAIDQAKANAKQNLQNATTLFESYLQGVFENKGNDWEEKRLDEVCEVTSKLIDPKELQYQELIHIGAGNIVSKKGTLINLKTAKEESLISGKFLFDETMILYSKIRPYLMKVVKCDFKGLCSADIYPLAPFRDKIEQEFLYHLLLSNSFTVYAIEGSQRAGMPKVNRKHLFEYIFFCPPIEQQQQIVQKLDKLSTKTKKLENVYQQKINNLEELKKSVLQKAFKGEL